MEGLGLPQAAGPWLDVCDFCLDGDLVSAVVRGQSADMGFLSHNIPTGVLRDIRDECSRGAPAAPVLHIVEAIVKAAKARQARQPEAFPMELESPSALIALCDEALAKIGEGDVGNRSGALYLRGVIWRSMDDFHAAAEDLRASYMASDGRAPWILRSAAWCTASSTEGLPARAIVENYKAAEVMYEEMLVFLDPMATTRNNNGNRNNDNNSNNNITHNILLII